MICLPSSLHTTQWQSCTKAGMFCQLVTSSSSECAGSSGLRSTRMMLSNRLSAAYSCSLAWRISIGCRLIVCTLMLSCSEVIKGFLRFDLPLVARTIRFESEFVVDFHLRRLGKRIACAHDLCIVQFARDFVEHGCLEPAANSSVAVRFHDAGAALLQYLRAA